MPSRLLFILFLVISSVSLPATTVLEEGFADFRTRGAEAALKTWTRNASDTALFEKARGNDLVAEQKRLGANLDYEIRFKTDLGSGSSLYLISSRFEKGTLFFRMVLFSNVLEQTSISSLRWSTDPSEVWPDQFLFPSRKN